MSEANGDLATTKLGMQNGAMGEAKKVESENNDGVEVEVRRAGSQPRTNQKRATDAVAVTIKKIEKRKRQIVL
jgi:hypothetical protein